MTRFSALCTHIVFSQLLPLRSIWMLSYPLFFWLTCSRTNTVRILDRPLLQALALFPLFLFLIYISNEINSDLELSNLCSKKKRNSCTSLDRPWGFQEVEAPRFQDNRPMKMERLWALGTVRLFTPGNIPGTRFCYGMDGPGSISGGDEIFPPSRPVL